MAMDHNVVRIKGSLKGGEQWSINPSFWDPSFPLSTPPATYDDLLAWATDIGALNGNQIFPAAVMAMISDAASITTVRTEHWADGVMTMAAEFVPPAPIVGAGGPNKPYQTALCASLRTGKPGRSYRGRLYFPALAIAVSSTDARISPVLSTTLSDQIAGWLTAVGIEGSFLGRTRAEPCIVSQVKQERTTVQTVAIGNVLDTQRRRRDSLVELYTTAAIGPIEQE